jgi:nitroreductase
MNQTITDILTRRSVREFTSSPVRTEELEIIIEAGLSAPSAHGKRPWHIAVISDPVVRDKMASLIPAFRPVAAAPVSILVLVHPAACVRIEYWPQDCGALSENILLASRALGLGTTWCGIYPIENKMTAIHNLLDIPEHLVPFSIIGIGHPSSPDAFHERDGSGDLNRVSWNPNWIRPSDNLT